MLWPDLTKWELVWADDFLGGLDGWRFEHGNGWKGWGNWELQSYTQRNARCQDGRLLVEARAEHTAQGFRYTSARLVSKRTVRYGRVQAKIRFPLGAGLWPTFWLLPADPTVVWPTGGEIDILDTTGTRNLRYWSEQVTDSTELHKVHQCVHTPHRYSGAAYAATHDVDPYHFHTYAVEWREDALQFFVDDTSTLCLSKDSLGAEWVFDNPMNVVLNLAVGGDWPGPPDRHTHFPARMEVEHVRIYQDRSPK